MAAITSLSLAPPPPRLSLSSNPHLSLSLPRRLSLSHSLPNPPNRRFSLLYAASSTGAGGGGNIAGSGGGGGGDDEEEEHNRFDWVKVKKSYDEEMKKNPLFPPTCGVDFLVKLILNWILDTDPPGYGRRWLSSLNED